jgi:hypothetical protein
MISSRNVVMVHYRASIGSPSYNQVVIKLKITRNFQMDKNIHPVGRILWVVGGF